METTRRYTAGRKIECHCGAPTLSVANGCASSKQTKIACVGLGAIWKVVFLVYFCVYFYHRGDDQASGTRHQAVHGPGGRNIECRCGGAPTCRKWLRWSWRVNPRASGLCIYIYIQKIIVSGLQLYYPLPVCGFVRTFDWLIDWSRRRPSRGDTAGRVLTTSSSAALMCGGAPICRTSLATLQKTHRRVDLITDFL